MAFLPDQCVDLDCIHIIELLQRIFNLPLIRLQINDKHEGIVLLDFLHCTLRVQWVNDHLVVI